MATRHYNRNQGDVNRIKVFITLLYKHKLLADFSHIFYRIETILLVPLQKYIYRWPAVFFS
jgi:hypothetical protein